LAPEVVSARSRKTPPQALALDDYGRPLVQIGHGLDDRFGNNGKGWRNMRKGASLPLESRRGLDAESILRRGVPTSDKRHVCALISPHAAEGYAPSIAATAVSFSEVPLHFAAYKAAPAAGGSRGAMNS
jgi:hypothetical protein